MTRDQCIALMIKLEGGFVDNPADPGGATKFGITQATLDSLQGKGLPTRLPTHVRDLTEDNAYAIYRAVQWAQIHGDALPGALPALMLNTAVNMGEPTAVKLLQECLGHVNPDGIMGPATLSAITTWHSAYMPGQSLAEEFVAHVGARYATLAGKGENLVFELGWFRRLFRVYTLALTT